MSDKYTKKEFMENIKMLVSPFEATMQPAGGLQQAQKPSLRDIMNKMPRLEK